MVALLATGVALLAVLVMVGGWVLYGLLRQNGRMLLRIDALEAALDHGAERPAGRVFADRSLAKSRLNRAGLAKGTAAPAFRLPMLDGSETALSDYAGRRLLLVFSDPACAPCTALLPKLGRIRTMKSQLAEPIRYWLMPPSETLNIFQTTSG